MYTLIGPVSDPSPSLRPVHYVVSFFLLLFSLTCLVILTGIAEHPYTASLRSSTPSLSSAPSSPLHVLSVPLAAPDYPYVAIIDAGSAGSRLYLYRYRWRRGGLHVHIAIDSDGAPIERKIEPGLSFYAAQDNHTAAALSLSPLISHLASRLPEPPSVSSSSSPSSPRLPLYLFATAGLRLLPVASQRLTLSACVALLPTLLPAVLFPSHHARVITGTEEALYAWLALNYALGTLSAGGGQQRRQTAGLVELGGASVQVAFEMTDGLRRSMMTEEEEAEGKELQLHPQYTATVHLHLRCASAPSVPASPPSLPSAPAAAASSSSALLLSEEDDGSSSYHLYVSTYLGYGSNTARQRYLALLVSAGQHLDPCMLKGNEGSINNGAFKLTGTGLFDDCRAALVPLLNKTAACSISPCSFNGVHQPAFDSSPLPPAASAASSSSSFMPFYGFSELFYTSLHLFNLTGLYSYRTFSTAARAFCSLPYDSVLQRYRDGLYGSVDEKRVRQQCFKAAWMSVVLHEGLGFRRGGGDDVAAVAEARQSMDREAEMSRREKRREGEIKDKHEAAPTKELVLSPKPSDAAAAAAASPGKRRLLQAAATVGNDSNSDSPAALPAADTEAVVSSKPPDSSHGQEAAQPSQLAATPSSRVPADYRQDEDEMSQPPPPASPPAVTPFSPPSQPRLPRHSHSASLTPLSRMPDGQEAQWTMGAALTLLSKQIGENPPACEEAQQAGGRAELDEAAVGGAGGGGGGGGGGVLWRWLFGRMRRLHVSLVLLLCAATAVLMLTVYGAVWLLDRRRFAHADTAWKQKLRRSTSANTVSISIRRW